MQKVILITGASQGMGKETARLLISKGHKVYAAARSIDKMNELSELGGFPIQMDITNEEDIQKVIDTIIQKENKIDVLFNNAGLTLNGAIEDIGIQEARYHFQVNLFGLASLTQKVIPYMRKAKAGMIINTTSVGGKMYSPLGAWYHASKHALEGWSDCLRLELKQFNIKVVILEPGAIESEFGDELESQLTRNSDKSAYTTMAQSLIKSGGSLKRSPRSVIANAVDEIINNSSPKTRYAVGNLAKPLIWMRVYLGDRLFDKLVMSQIK